MSIGWSKKSTIYSNVAESVETQLNTRKSIVEKRKRTDSDLLFLNSNTGWVKLSSGADVSNTDNSNTASQNILFGGTYNGSLKQGFTQDNNSSYSHSKRFGFRPMAGITRVSINSQGTFGAIKKATVEFQVNSLDDLEKFERLYLLPGYSMLLEWGHSVLLDNNTGTTSSNIKTYNNWFDGLPPNDPKKGIHRSVAILKQLKKLRTDQSNNYDALLGKTSNFIWSYNNEGVYDCSIDITGYGELTESLSALFQPGVSEKERELGIVNKIYHYLDTILSSVPAPTGGMTGVIKERDFKSMKFTNDAKPEILREFNNVFVANIDTANSDKPSGFNSYRYITLGSFLNFINNNYQLKDSNIPFVKFYCGKFDSKPSGKYENRNAFATFSNHVSLQPDICILPKPKNSNALLKLNVASSQGVHNCIKGNTDDLLNLLINVSFLKNMYSEILENNKNKDINIYDMLRSLLDSINSTLGNINDLDLFEEDQRYYIVDRKITPKNNEIGFTLDLVGLKGLTTNISVSSNIPSNASNLIAIAASAGGSSLTEDIFSFTNFYDNVRDRIVPQRSLDNINSDNAQQRAAEENKLYNHILDISAYYNAINKKNTLPTASIAKLKPAHQAVMILLYKNEIITKKTNPPGILPIQLSFDILGISGFRITDVFKLGPGLLPSRYNGNVSFTITGLDNKIENNQWITSISALMMITAQYNETVVVKNPITDRIKLIQDILAVDQDDESLFPNATELRKIIATKPNFSEKGYELTSSGEDIEKVTANRGQVIMSNIQRKLSEEGIKDLHFRWTGGHDFFHILNPIPPKSTFHRKGRALDLAIQQTATTEQVEKASAIVEGIIAGMVESGLVNFLNEYKTPTGHATGGHWHFTFN